MRYSTSRCNCTRRLCGIAGLTLGSLLLLALGGGGETCSAATWETYPWVSVAGGHESDRIIEEGTDRFVVPAGPFFDIRPGVLLSRHLGENTRLNLDGELSFEQFGNDDNRSLLGAAFNAELRRRFGSIWRWRLTAGTNYFGDSVQETTNRFRVGGEAAIGVTGRRGFLELIAGAQGRRYPRLTTIDDAGVPGTYTEIGGSVGVTGAIVPLSRFEVSGIVNAQTTNARDPYYDANAYLAQAAVRVRVAGPLQVFTSFLVQERELSARPAGEDSDSYRQIGAGVAYPIGRSLDISARYAFARYEDPLGVSDDIERFAVTLTWWPGGRGIRSLPPRVLYEIEEGGNDGVIRAGRPHRFRFEAPGATRVALVGDFNGWDPGAHAMQKDGDGWWEVRAALPAGTHQYAYWVDGTLVTPPEAEVTMDDGFGGRNGLVSVVAESP